MHIANRACWLSLVMLLSGCSVVPAQKHWQQLGATPPSELLADDDSVLRGVRPIEMRVGQKSIVRIEHRDPVVVRDGASSYVKLFRFHAIERGVYKATVEAWCDCPWTAVLGGEREFPVFYPGLVVLDARGMRMIPTSEDVVHRQPLLTATWVKGVWEVNLSDARPYFLMITSQHHGPTTVGDAGNVAVHVSSPVGKVRVGVERVGGLSP
jgi:hypothetical protein